MLVVIVVAGLAGGSLIRRNLCGRRAFGAWMLWLPVPFVILLVVLAVEIDPSLPPERASYNLSFGFVLVSILMAIPWFLANAIGAAVTRTRPRLADRVTQSRRAVSTTPLPDPDLPDWSRADNPRLDYWQISALMREKAARAGIDPEALPHLSMPGNEDGEYLFLDKFDYLYVGIMGGKPQFEHATVIADRLLYYVFVDRAAVLAMQGIGSDRLGDPGVQEEIRLRQKAILARIDPRWARQYERDCLYRAQH
jgi:hypothetical protein